MVFLFAYLTVAVLLFAAAVSYLASSLSDEAFMRELMVETLQDTKARAAWFAVFALLVACAVWPGGIAYYIYTKIKHAE